jgi:gliding motility-associated-like protein
MLKKVTALLLILGLAFSARAAIFIVTSNADSGPGTLRNAIEMANANGTSAPDFIHFNIPIADFNSRIIYIDTELPPLSSNITIDGTTQPGAAYGSSSAKICLKKDVFTASFTMLDIQNASGVNIYGLNLYYGYWEGFFLLPDGSSKPRSSQLYGIKLSNAFNIEIGAPGKGNVLNGFEYPIYSQSDSCRGLTIRSNYINLGKFYENPADEIDEVIVIGEYSLMLYNVFDVVIGGADAADGNLLGGRQPIFLDSEYEKANGTLLIQHNIIGRQYDRKKILEVSGSLAIQIGKLFDWGNGKGMDYTLHLLDNDFPKQVVISHLTEPFLIRRNKFETEGLTNLSTYKCALYKCTGGGIIGGDDQREANFFRNLDPNRIWRDYGWVSIHDCGPVYVSKNIFECSVNYGSPLAVFHHENPPPFIQVDQTTSTGVRGRATPHSIVHIYYDDACSACEGQRFITTVTAGADSLWSYTGTITGTVVATSTINDRTGRFSEPLFFDEKLVIKHPTCGQSNGSITGIRTEGAETYFWLRYHGANGASDTVGKSLDLVNVGPGEYQLFGVHGGTCIKPSNGSIKLEDVSPKIETGRVTIAQPSCGNFNGSVSNLYVYLTFNSVVTWQGQKVASFNNPLQFNQLAPGSYQLIARDTVRGCADTANFTLSNQTGPSLEQQNMVVRPANCSNSDGSITGITVKNTLGTSWAQWEDSMGKSVSDRLDLINAAAGKYRLKYKDDSNCDTIITPFYTIASRGAIIIDTAGKLVRPSSCGGADGGISNIKVTAGSTFTWRHAVTNAIVGNAQDATNLPPGQYRLEVGNSEGCSAISPIILVPPATFEALAVTQMSVLDASCEKQNGSVGNFQFSRDTTLYSFRWLDSASNRPLTTGIHLSGMGAGTYLLEATDQNGCASTIASARIKQAPKPSFDYTTVLITNDLCGQQQGGISRLTVANLTGPTTYAWSNDQGTPVATSPSLLGVPAGIYHLQVTDGANCVIRSEDFTLIDQTQALPLPSYNNLIVARNSPAQLTLLNPAPGVYQLSGGLQGSQQNGSGNFITEALPRDTILYIQRQWGSCTSEQASVKIEVVDATKIFVPTGFTPNKDGRNDLLRPIISGQFEQEYFMIFDRWGNMVFRSQKQNEGWDGRLGGKDAPVGVYVWLIRGKDINGKTLQQNGSFMLMR